MRLPERYAPGELDRTKRNLGDITREEAKEMSRILGGDIGTERSQEEIDKKYRDLADLNRRRSDRFIRTTTNSLIFERRDGPDSENRIPAPPKLEEVKYLQRVRMNFIAARPEHQLMKYSRALLSLLSFAIPVKDLVNPAFVKKGDAVFFDHIEEFVTSVKSLAARAKGSPLTKKIHPFYFRVIDEICGWEIERIHEELTYMQRSPRNISFEQCRSLCSAFYKPLISLMDIDEEFFVGGALKKLHDAVLLTIPKNHPDVELIKRFYRTARAKMTLIFREMKFRLYPLLLKVSSDYGLEYDEFFVENRDEILDSLSITPEHVLHAPVIDESDDWVDSINENQEGAGPEEAETAEESTTDEEDPLMAQEVQVGIDVLQKLFPGAGFGVLKDNPDLYRYFQPFLDFPRGVELISPADPLHQVVVLVAILQELFYGFKSISFGTLRDSDGDSQAVGERIETRLIAWRAVFDDTILDAYVMELYEYCRQFEKENLFGTTRIGKRLGLELEWKKKLLILPHLPIHRPYGFSDETMAHLPRLQREIDHLDMYLSVIAHSLATEAVTDSVVNADSLTEFEVPNAVSKRLAKVLRSEGKQFTNSQLILYAASILSLLRSLISNPDSHLYQGDSPLFRSDPGSDGKPMFTVAPLNPREIIQKHDDQNATDEVRADGQSRDPVSGFFVASLLKRYLQSTLNLCESREESCCFIAIGIQGFQHMSKTMNDEAKIGEQHLIRQIKQNIRAFSDIPFRITPGNFIIILPDTKSEEALVPIKRIFAKQHASSDKESHIPLSAAVVEHQSGISVDHHLRHLRAAIRDVFKLPAPGLVVFNHETGNATPVPLP